MKQEEEWELMIINKRLIEIFCFIIKAFALMGKIYYLSSFIYNIANFQDFTKYYLDQAKNEKTKTTISRTNGPYILLNTPIP